MMYMKQTRQSLQAFGNDRNNELEKVEKQTNQWKNEADISRNNSGPRMLLSTLL